MAKNSRKSLPPLISNTLKSGGVGVLLTDTIYGIVGSALSRKAVNRIYEIKGRTETKPFIILIAGVKDLEIFDIKLKPTQKKVLHALWKKKPTSIILSVPQKKFEYLHRGTKSLAFRIPFGAPNLVRLINANMPIVAPSANPQGEEPARNIKEAENYFGSKVDFYLDGGTRRGKPSRLIRLDSNGKIEILRK